MLSFIKQNLQPETQALCIFLQTLLRLSDSSEKTELHGVTRDLDYLLTSVDKIKMHFLFLAN